MKPTFYDVISEFNNLRSSSNKKILFWSVILFLGKLDSYNTRQVINANKVGKSDSFPKGVCARKLLTSDTVRQKTESSQ